MKSLFNKYKCLIVFKHLPWWSKVQIVEAKSEKKAKDIILRMYRDKVLRVEVKQIS